MEKTVAPTKRCPMCREVLPLDSFPKNRATKDGRATYCKPCHNARMRAYKERAHGSQRNYLLKLRYGISAETFEALRQLQDGRCAVCLRERKLQVDHDHATGEVRGLLCFNCNAGVGQVADDPDRLDLLADYLEGAR